MSSNPILADILDILKDKSAKSKFKQYLKLKQCSENDEGVIKFYNYFITDEGALYVFDLSKATSWASSLTRNNAISAINTPLNHSVLLKDALGDKYETIKSHCSSKIGQSENSKKEENSKNLQLIKVQHNGQSESKQSVTDDQDDVESFISTSTEESDENIEVTPPPNVTNLQSSHVTPIKPPKTTDDSLDIHMYYMNKLLEEKECHIQELKVINTYQLEVLSKLAFQLAKNNQVDN
ncbi:MAG: hypothetical protein H9536_11210 [Aphanizomenon flos-aquae Clear-A1]|nr:hypothetical protein [Aphanizomenon flos-aquae Clear-A1]